MGVEEYLPGKWRLFVGSNKRSLKYVLLYNRNEYSPVPIGDSVHVKEKYEKIKVVLNLLKYQERNCIDCNRLHRLKNGKLSIGTTKWLHQIPMLLVSLGQSC